MTSTAFIFRFSILWATLFLPFFGVAQEFNTHFPLKPGFKHKVNGVNCHSATLQAAGLIDYPSYVDNDEIEFILRWQCQPVSGPGDGVIALQSRGTLFSHSYFHISTGEVFEKASLDMTSPYRRLRRGRSEAEYFTCRRIRTVCSDPELHAIDNDIRRVGLYYANLAAHFKNPNDRYQFRQLLKTRRAQLRTLEVPKNCRWDKARLQLRAQSLKQLAESNSGVQFFLQRLPRGNLGSR